MNEIVYRASGIRKKFGHQVVLEGIELELRKGEVLGIVGSNGAGKSTLMRILAGALPPDEGRLFLNGAEIEMRSMQEAWREGIAFVSQELNLFPTLSIAENLALVPGHSAAIARARIKNSAVSVLKELGLEVDLSKQLGSLSLADRQLIEIARALLQFPRVLILDEPTSALQSAEVDRLHRVLHQLRCSGTAIIYISHFIEELLDISDTLVVLRDGRRVPLASEKPSVAAVVSAMLGDRAPRPVIERRLVPEVGGLGAKTLRLAALRGPIALTVDSFHASSGEVVGLAGLAGSGIEELFAILFGRLSPIGGQIALPSGRKYKASTSAAVSNGVAYVPADRKRLGLALEQSIADNVSAVRALTLGRDGFILNRGRQAALARTQSQAVGVKMTSVDQAVGNLSGGNQQKVVFAKWIEGDPSLMLLDDPMRGVDIGAKRELYQVIRHLSSERRVILFYSSDPSDYVAVADRVVVFVDGEIAGELSGENLTEHDIVASMNGSGSAGTGFGVPPDMAPAPLP